MSVIECIHCGGWGRYHPDPEHQALTRPCHTCRGTGAANGDGAAACSCPSCRAKSGDPPDEAIDALLSWINYAYTGTDARVRAVRDIRELAALGFVWKGTI